MMTGSHKKYFQCHVESTVKMTSQQDDGEARAMKETKKLTRGKTVVALTRVYQSIFLVFSVFCVYKIT